MSTKEIVDALSPCMTDKDIEKLIEILEKKRGGNEEQNNL